jgi:hypothetical protein
MTGQAMEMLKKGADEAEVKERLTQLVKKGVKVKESREPVTRLRAKTGGMSVVRTLWRKKLAVGSGQCAVGGEGKLVWTVMTRERVYEVRLENLPERLEAPGQIFLPV